MTTNNTIATTLATLFMTLSSFALSAHERAALPDEELPEGASEAVAKEHKGIVATLGADLVAQYYWRGQNLGQVSLQPTLGLEWRGLSLSAWGNVGISNFNDDKEVDLTLAYSIGGFNVGVTDYWFSKGSYFQYKAHKTTHVWEANVGYDFGFLSVQWYTNFAGNDARTASGKRAFSSYVELSAPFRLAKLDWQATVGAVPYATDFYDANGFCVTNVMLQATKDFVIKEKYHLPVSAGLAANPRLEKFYVLFGVGFRL